MLFEAAYEMTAVREARVLTDIIQVVVGEQQILFRLEDPHPLDVLLAGQTVLLLELCREAGIAHVAFLRDLRNADILFKTAVDILRDILYPVDIRRAHRASVYIQPL